MTSDNLAALPSMPSDVRCHVCDRRATHQWGMATGRDDHTCCVHWVLSGGLPATATGMPDDAHVECLIADEVVLGQRPVTDLSDVLGDLPLRTADGGLPRPA